MGSSDPGEPRTILLIDDDQELAELMDDYFAPRGLALDAVADGLKGLRRALEGRHDLVLLDVMLPGLDGFEVLRQLRRQSAIPVIMLTARTSSSDRVHGLETGADDYLPKPFGPEELVARIRAVLRRAAVTPPRPELLDLGELQLDPARREVRHHGRAVELTALEFDLLETLARAAGRTVSREQLTAALYHRKVVAFDRSLDVHVSHVRKKLGPVGDRIRTVRGVGYLLAPDPASPS